MVLDACTNHAEQTTRHWLCRSDDDSPFVYACGHDLIRRSDETLWAHITDGVLSQPDRANRSPTKSAPRLRTTRPASRSLPLPLGRTLLALPRGQWREQHVVRVTPTERGSHRTADHQDHNPHKDVPMNPVVASATTQPARGNPPHHTQSRLRPRYGSAHSCLPPNPRRRHDRGLLRRRSRPPHHRKPLTARAITAVTVGLGKAVGPRRFRPIDPHGPGFDPRCSGRVNDIRNRRRTSCGSASESRHHHLGSYRVLASSGGRPERAHLHRVLLVEPLVLPPRAIMAYMVNGAVYSSERDIAFGAHRSDADRFVALVRRSEDGLKMKTDDHYDESCRNDRLEAVARIASSVRTPQDVEGNRRWRRKMLGCCTAKSDSCDSLIGVANRSRVCRGTAVSGAAP